jgi:hypothetical protein
MVKTKLDNIEYSIINNDLDILSKKISDIEREVKFLQRISWIIYIFIAVSCLKIIFFKT